MTTAKMELFQPDKT